MHSNNDKSLPPPSKSIKLCVDDQDEPDISEEEYKEAVKELQGNHHFIWIH